MIENGTRNIEANSGTVDKTTISPAMLPRYMLAIVAQTKSLCSTKSNGPGLRPQIMSPPSSTADVAEPGMPSVSIGSNALVPAACAAVSGAITPSMAPLPKRPRSRANFLARPYPMNVAAMAPPRRNAQPAAHDGAAHKRQPIARQLCPGLEHDREIRIRAPAFERETVFHPDEDLADTEETDNDDQEVESAQQQRQSEGHARCPETVSMPTAASVKPMPIEMMILAFASFPVPTKLQKVNKYTAKNSGGTKRRANVATRGARKVINKTPTSAPMKEPVNALVSASAARPCCAIG